MKWRILIAVATVVVLAVLAVVLVGCGGIQAFGMLQAVGR